jgi:outer membrane lipoprotein carrier protein
MVVLSKDPCIIIGFTPPGQAGEEAVVKHRSLKPLLAVLAAAITFLGAAPSAPPPVDAQVVLDGVQRWLDGTQDLRGRFVQSLVSGAFGAGVEESGLLQVRRPGRMRWDYQKPETKVALIDGRRTRLYLARDRQLWEGTLDEAGSLLPALLAQDTRLAELFRASLAAPQESDGPGAVRLRLVPRAAQNAFREVTLTLDRTFAIHAAEVQDGTGNHIVYRFQGLARNQGIPDSAFHFEPPPGTERVVREPRPAVDPG